MGVVAEAGVAVVAEVAVTSVAAAAAAATKVHRAVVRNLHWTRKILFVRHPQPEGAGDAWSDYSVRCHYWLGTMDGDCSVVVAGMDRYPKTMRG